jgi:hypothetical protein
MIETAGLQLSRVSVHRVENKNNGGNLILSNNEVKIEDSTLKELLIKYFIHPFNTSEYYHFSFTNEDFNMNPLYQYVGQIFDSSNLFHPNSINIAKHLYELSIHPNIKNGDLFVVYFPKINLDNTDVEAVGIFKSENQQSFLKVEEQGTDFSIFYANGINIDKLDKGCLIYHLERDKGFKISIIDKSNKSSEAQFWKDNFLQLKPCADEFHFTKDFLTLTKNYITQNLTEEFEVSKTEQIDLLKKSVEYFKKNDVFEKESFQNEVFEDENYIKSFKNFEQVYSETNNYDIIDSFEIDNQAVKKQARVFKSILKLDKNFHVYIHGNKNMIERGVDPDGRKYYKLYYSQEE